VVFTSAILIRRATHRGVGCTQVRRKVWFGSSWEPVLGAGILLARQGGTSGAFAETDRGTADTTVAEERV
jgi:hypothetical protein